MAKLEPWSDGNDPVWGTCRIWGQVKTKVPVREKHWMRNLTWPRNYDKQNIITDECWAPESKKKEKSYKLQAASFKRLKNDTIK